MFDSASLSVADTNDFLVYVGVVCSETTLDKNLLLLAVRAGYFLVMIVFCFLAVSFSLLSLFYEIFVLRSTLDFYN